jgi:hypothetical protein
MISFIDLIFPMFTKAQELVWFVTYRILTFVMVLSMQIIWEIVRINIAQLWLRYKLGTIESEYGSLICGTTES